MLAQFASHFVEGQVRAAQEGLADVRTGLGRYVDPPVLEAGDRGLAEQAARLARTRRAVGLVNDALRGRVYVPRTVTDGDVSWSFGRCLLKPDKGIAECHRQVPTRGESPPMTALQAPQSCRAGPSGPQPRRNRRAGRRRHAGRRGARARGGVDPVRLPLSQPHQRPGRPPPRRRSHDHRKGGGRPQGARQADDRAARRPARTRSRATTETPPFRPSTPTSASSSTTTSRPAPTGATRSVTSSTTRCSRPTPPPSRRPCATSGSRRSTSTRSMATAPPSRAARRPPPRISTTGSSSRSGGSRCRARRGRTRPSLASESRCRPTWTVTCRVASATTRARPTSPTAATTRT